MSSAAVDRLLPALDSPVDTLDSLLTAGAALGLLTYASGLALGDVEAATVGVGLGVVCVVAALSIRSARDVAETLA